MISVSMNPDVCLGKVSLHEKEVSFPIFIHKKGVAKT